MEKHRKTSPDTQEDLVPETPPPTEQADGSPRSDSPSGVERQEEAARAANAAGASQDALERALEVEKDKYLRLAAEFDNYRKRMLRERQEAGWRAQGDLILSLLEALDDLQRFAHVDPASTDAPTVVRGVELVEKKLLKALASHGLEVLNPVDQVFDPTFHEAVSTEPALSPEDDDLISTVFQPGYVFKGQLLRPARVVVRQWPG